MLAASVCCCEWKGASWPLLISLPLRLDSPRPLAPLPPLFSAAPFARRVALAFSASVCHSAMGLCGAKESDGGAKDEVRRTGNGTHMRQTTRSERQTPRHSHDRSNAATGEESKRGLAARLNNDQQKRSALAHATRIGCSSPRLCLLLCLCVFVLSVSACLSVAVCAMIQFDYRKIEAYLRTHTSLAHVLSDAELTDFSRYFHIVDFLAGVSICADGDVGRDLYVIASGEISMYIEEELFCQKKENDYISFAARYPAEGSGAALSASASAMRVEEMAMQRSASSGSGGGSMMHTRHSAGSITEKPGFGKCLAVSTAQSRLIHLTRERWIEFQQAHTGDGDLCERIYQLVVEPSASLANLNFFRGISSRMLQNIGMMFRTVYLKKGEVLFEELEEGHSLFIVSSGTAEAFVPREDGSEKVLKLFKTGDILGEIALIMNVPRTATVRATSNCFLLELHRENFKKFVKFVPATGNIHSIMKSRTAEHFRKYKVPFFNSIPDDKVRPQGSERDSRNQVTQ